MTISEEKEPNSRAAAAAEESMGLKGGSKPLFMFRRTLSKFWASKVSMPGFISISFNCRPISMSLGLGVGLADAAAVVVFGIAVRLPLLMFALALGLELGLGFPLPLPLALPRTVAEGERRSKSSHCIH